MFSCYGHYKSCFTWKLKVVLLDNWINVVCTELRKSRRVLPLLPHTEGGRERLGKWGDAKIPCSLFAFIIRKCSFTFFRVKCHFQLCLVMKCEKNKRPEKGVGKGRSESLKGRIDDLFVKVNTGKPKISQIFFLFWFCFCFPGLGLCATCKLVYLFIYSSGILLWLR